MRERRQTTVRHPGWFAMALVVALGASTGLASAGDYYVAPGGDDAAAGSPAKPWKTLQHAAQSVKAGDTVVVRKGRYRGFNLTRSGVSGNRIVFRGESGAVINGGNPRTPDGINLEGASHITIEGFEVRGAGRAGIRAATCKRVTIRNNRVLDNRKWGIFTAFCDDVLVEGNQLSNSREQHGVYFSNSGDRPVVRRNRIWGNAKNGIHLNGDASMGGDGIISGALVEENILYRNGAKGGAAINGDGLQQSTIRNNLLYDNHANGIALYRIDGGGPSRGNTVEHNTIVMPTRSRWCIRIANGSTGNRLRNNILLSAHNRRGALDVSRDSLEGLRSDYNVLIARFTLDDGNSVLSLERWRRASGQDKNSRAADGRTLFEAGGSYRLKAGSAAIDTGGSAKLDRDLAGNIRPVNGAMDVGAYEWCERCTKAGTRPNVARPEPVRAAKKKPRRTATPSTTGGHPLAGLKYSLAMVPPQDGRVLYVAQRGRDSDPGTEERPWKTLQYAANRARPGDTVVVEAGLYRGFEMRHGGTRGRPIRFLGKRGARINRNNSRTPDAINIEGAGDIWIEGFNIVGATRAGIRAVQCRRITVRRNKIDQNGRWGVFTGFCDDLHVEGNELSRSGEQHGVYASNSGDRPIIRGNRIWGNNVNGIHLNGDASMGGDGVISDALVEDNVIYDNGAKGGAAINGDGLTRSVIRNNLLYGNHGNGIALYRIDAGAGSTDNQVVHNTIVMPAKSRWCVRIVDGSTGNTLRNNVFLSAHARRGAIDISKDSLPGTQSDYNVVIARFTDDDAETIMDLAAWRRKHKQDAHSVVVRAGQLFVSAAANDYRLRAGSPAIDLAEGELAVRDVAGRERPVGRAADLGAFEACTGNACIAAELPEPDAARGTADEVPLPSAAGANAGPQYCCHGQGAGGSAALASCVFFGLRRRRED